MGVGFVAGDGAVGGDAWVDGGLDKVEDRGVGGGVPLGDHAVEADAVFISPGAWRGGGGRVLLEDGSGHLLGWCEQGGGRRGGLRRGDLGEGAGGVAEEQCCGEQIRQAHGSFSADQDSACADLVLEGEGDQLGEGRSMESMMRTSMGSLAGTSLRPS